MIKHYLNIDGKGYLISDKKEMYMVIIAGFV
jgi:hypothetical protein